MKLFQIIICNMFHRRHWVEVYWPRREWQCDLCLRLFHRRHPLFGLFEGAE
jgi:hypothetical protein